MAYHVEKNKGGQNEIVIDGFDNGIQVSPHKGIADIKNLNINSLSGEASVNYERVKMLPKVTNASASAVGVTAIYYNYSNQSKEALVVGSCIVPTASTISGLNVGSPYWVTSVSSFTVYLATDYSGTYASLGTTGTATFSTYTVSKFVQSSFEIQNNAYIYYVCDTRGVVWVNYSASLYGDIFVPAGDSNGIAVVNNVTGFSVSQGTAFIFSPGNIYANFTSTIGVYARNTTTNAGWYALGGINTPDSNTSIQHFAIRVPDQNGSIYYCDSQWIGQITGLSSRFSQFVASSNGAGGATVTITSYEQGVIPADDLPIAVILFTSITGLNGATQYYIKSGSYNKSAGTFDIVTGSPTGTPVSITTAGTFRVTSFDISKTVMSSITYEALALPYTDTANCIEQYSQGGGLSLAIGTIESNVYFWTPGTSAPSSVLSLPETGTHRLLNVDNTIYAFSGNKGNVYIVNGSQIAGVFSIPDYIADQYGQNQNPWFVWGDVIFLRGRVFFSVQDQNASNTTGNCGGIWSFTPTQNLFLGQTQGIQLRLEHQNSYGTYNGICDVFIAPKDQKSNGAQYWSMWTDGYSSSNHNIDYPATTPYNGTQYGQIDTDIIPVGTFTEPYTSSSIEYKLSRPMVLGESIEILARQNLTETFTQIGTDTTVGNMSANMPTTIQLSQWLQLRIKLKSTTTSPSFMPLKEIRIKP